MRKLIYLSICLLFISLTLKAQPTGVGTFRIGSTIESAFPGYSTVLLTKKPFGKKDKTKISASYYAQENNVVQLDSTLELYEWPFALCITRFDIAKWFSIPSANFYYIKKFQAGEVVISDCFFGTVDGKIQFIQIDIPNEELITALEQKYKPDSSSKTFDTLHCQYVVSGVPHNRINPCNYVRWKSDSINALYQVKVFYDDKCKADYMRSSLRIETVSFHSLALQAEKLKLEEEKKQKEMKASGLKDVL